MKLSLKEFVEAITDIDKNIADGSFVTKDLLDKEVDRATKKEDSLSALIQDETELN